MTHDRPVLKNEPVLDKGFVQLIDVMGDDQRVIDAARVSTGSASDPDRDKGLIFYLMENRHETPFEKIVFEFHVKCPIFVARQWVRHRIGSFNERSARYRAFPLDFFVPDPATLPEGISRQDLDDYEAALNNAHQLYERMIARTTDLPREERSRVREVFRGLLGTAYYTEFFWTVNFRSLMNFLRLRLAGDAQYEIRRYAEVIDAMIPEYLPWSYEAFRVFVLQTNRKIQPHP